MEEKAFDGEPESTVPESIQYRGADGEWHHIAVEPKRTGDPELDAIWEMSLDKLEQLLEDESHPMHDKAKQVSAEVLKPIVDAAREMMRPLTESIARSTGTSGIAKVLFPARDTSSWLAKMAPELQRFQPPEGLLKQHMTTTKPELDRALGAPERGYIDFDAIDPPNASLAEIQEAAEARAHEMRSKQIEILTGLLFETRSSGELSKEALDVSRQSLKATKSSKHAGWIAAWAAIGAAVTSVAGIIVTVWLSR